ncbi:MAG: restriction endonuclease subunit S, partial [Spirochaetaceae bacterium]|nr:restriction endonuclease subunit S [Spirochaetaceae bacterium]
KNISTAVKKKAKIKSKWEQILFINAIKKVEGSTEKIEKFNINETGKYPVITQEREQIISGYSDNQNPVTDVPILLFGDHSCTLKYLDFKFFRGADGTVLLKPKDDFLPKYFYNVLQYGLLDLMENKEKYERHYKYLQNLYIPRPPTDIQQKIVAEIEVLEKKEADVKEKIEGLRKKIDEIIKNKFLHECKLGDIVFLEYGTALSEKDRIKGAYPVVGSNGIVGWHNDFLVEAPVIVVGRKGSAGKVNWIDNNCTPIDTTFFVKTKDAKYSLKILYYAIKNLDLESLAGGTGVPGLNRNVAYTKNIKVPPLPEQQKIAAEIEKIEMRIVEAQEELDAMTEFKKAVLQKYL